MSEVSIRRPFGELDLSNQPLYVSVKTIETYRKQIMNELNLHSNAELTKYADRIEAAFS